MDDPQLAVLCGPCPSSVSVSRALSMLQPTHHGAMGFTLQMGNGGTDPARVPSPPA